LKDAFLNKAIVLQMLQIKPFNETTHKSHIQPTIYNTADSHLSPQFYIAMKLLSFVNVSTLLIVATVSTVSNNYLINVAAQDESMYGINNVATSTEHNAADQYNNNMNQHYDTSLLNDANSQLQSFEYSPQQQQQQQFVNNNLVPSQEAAIDSADSEAAAQFLPTWLAWKGAKMAFKGARGMGRFALKHHPHPFAHNSLNPMHKNAKLSSLLPKKRNVALGAAIGVAGHQYIKNQRNKNKNNRSSPSVNDASDDEENETTTNNKPSKQAQETPLNEDEQGDDEAAEDEQPQKEGEEEIQEQEQVNHKKPTTNKKKPIKQQQQNDAAEADDAEYDAFFDESQQDDEDDDDDDEDNESDDDSASVNSAEGWGQKRKPTRRSIINQPLIQRPISNSRRSFARRSSGAKDQATQQAQDVQQQAVQPVVDALNHPVDEAVKQAQQPLSQADVEKQFKKALADKINKKLGLA
jgi:hypothetical protein